MPRVNTLVNKFNRGEVSPLALSRVDLEGISDMCETMTNFEPQRLGAMAYRVGNKYLGNLSGESYNIPFVFDADDSAIIQFTNNAIEIWVDDAVVTRTAVTSTITNGTFTSNVTSWTDADAGSSASTWKTGGYMSLIGDGASAAKRWQTVTAEVDVQHGLRIVIADANVHIDIGTTGVDSYDIYSGDLSPGTHSLAFTPTGNFTITLSNAKKYEALVDSVAIEGAGTLSIPTAVPTASLPLLRYDQSADVIFCAVKDIPWFKIERRGTRSWSVVDFRPEDGPYGQINVGETSLTPAALSGNTTLTASKDFFTTSDHEGVLFKLESAGQEVSQSISGENQETGGIKVTGVGNTRKFEITISGTWSATITLQRSIAEIGAWEDVKTYSSNQSSVTYDDGLDNSIIYYRLACKAGDYTSGTATAGLIFPGGSISGNCRVVSVTSPTVAQVQVINDFGKTTSTLNWYRSEYSAGDGYPSAVALYEGRTWWAGKNKFTASVSDLYQSFDSTVEGDSKSLRRTIGFGPVDNVSWLCPAMRLISGTAGSEISIRSSGFSEPLTATNINLKETSTQGSKTIDYVKIDRNVYFCHRSGTKVFELSQSNEADEYHPSDIMILHPEMALAGIKRIVSQRQPETRLHVVLDDGTVIVNLQDATEGVRAWYRLTYSGLVEDVVVLPGDQEDQVYYTINFSGTRHFVKQAMITECRASTTSKHFDSFVEYTSPGVTLTGLSHLEGLSVGVWADGQDRGDYTVASGSVTLSGSYTSVVAGLRYTATWKSPKLAYAAGMGTAIGQRKNISQVAFLLRDYYPNSLKVGPTNSTVKPFPAYENGKLVDTTAVIEEYDHDAFGIEGSWTTDSRVHLVANNPVTVQAMVLSVTTHDK